MRALVIDDSPTVRRILARMLGELGYQVHEAGDGSEALALFSEIGHFELALVDWNLPGIDGGELLRAVRARVEWATTRLVVVTANNDASSIRAALDAGADEYMMKPFTRGMLTDKLAMLGLCGAAR